MVFAWVMIVIIAIVGVVSALLISSDIEEAHKMKVWVVCIGVAVAINSLILWWVYATESGKRMQKTFDSETSGGLYRTITVYDISGEQIASYEGKFDVDESAVEGITKIKFDMDGKRHIIYCSTGTVIIDEIDEPKE